MKPTIKDIAKEAGVSPTTVSLVLNGRTSSVGKTTASTIRAIASKLNYQPNHIAKSLVTKKTQTIGLIIPNIVNPFFAELALAIEESIATKGYNLVLTNTNESNEKDLEYLNVLHARGVDGIFMALSPITTDRAKNAIIEAVNRLDIPVVAIDRWIDGLACNLVAIDHRKGAYLATSHLLDLGHERIVMLSGPLSTYTGQLRLQGFKDAHEAYGFPYDESLMFEGDYTMTSGQALAASIVDKHPTAVFAANDMMAIGLMREARNHGLKIPEDLSVIGFDNLTLASLIDTPLTTVHQPLKSLGEHAADMMLEKIKLSQTLNHNIKLDPEVIIRSTTQPPRKKV